MRLARAALAAFSASAAEVPDGDGWLGSEERRVLQGLRFLKRREDWRLGRWVGKQALRCALFHRMGSAPSLEEIEIRAAADGAPEVFLDGEPFPFEMSLSHSQGVGFGIVAEAGDRPGCDVERIEPRDPRFLADYFSNEEARLVAERPEEERALVATLVWSAKESALKSLREGLRRDTRSVRVHLDGVPDACGWAPLRVRCEVTSRDFLGQWFQDGSRVFTLVSARLPEQPFPVAGPLRAGLYSAP